MGVRLLVALVLSSVLSGAADGSETVAVGSRFTAKDTLACGPETNEDAKLCLEGLSWAPGEFPIHLEAAQPDRGDFLVRFPSPRPVGNATNDLVAMEWYAARDFDKSLLKARAVVVVHESGRGMTVGRLIAKGLSTQGLHTFMIQMPGYGARRVEGASDIEQILPAMRQAIADVRRARDVVVALPFVDDSVVGLQGTSLGGFVTATTAGLDQGFDRVFILLAGGNLHDVVLQGQKDAAGVREKLRAAGVTDEQIMEFARPIEPLRVAHRLVPATTWLYSGKFDDVVPPACSLALVKAAKLAEDHHIEMPADHYSGVIYLPMVMLQIHERMTGKVAEP